MTMEENLIRQVPIFAALPAEGLQLLRESMYLSSISAGELLFREGELSQRFSIILDGQVEIIQALETPEERLLSVEGPGDILGEVSLLDPDHRRSASGKARTNVQLIEMTSTDFERLIHQHAPLAVALLRQMSYRMRRSEKMTIQDLQEKNIQLTRALQDLRSAQAQLIEKEKLEQELRLARVIQEGTLPKEMPELHGWCLKAYWQPARMVGGDFYDFIPLPDQFLGLVIGDVSGKGMPAAMVMATFRSLLHYALLNTNGNELFQPGKVLARINEMCFRELPASMFITCQVLLVNQGSGALRFANAGHNPPYKCSSRAVSELWATGMPLGLMPGMVYEESETIIEDGESLFLYSDGLVEAHNPSKEMYGAARLREQLALQKSGVGLVDSLIDHILEFTGQGWEQEDDITCVVLERSSQDKS
jgi:serine phosphatase RsbU (regulator of sigma subunit)